MALVARSFGRIAGPFVAIVAVLFAFQIALITVAASFARAGNFDRLAQLVPPALQMAVAPALTSFGRMTTIGYFDALIVMLVVQWAIFVATEPAGEIESGLVDLVLARSIPRNRLITRSLIVMTASTLMLTLGMGLGTWLGLVLLAPEGAAWPETRIVLSMIAHLTMVGWCYGAAALAASGWARRRASALAPVAIAAIGLYLVDVLGLWWRPAERLAHLSPSFYFHGGPILAGRADPVRNLTVLGAATVAATVLAYWRFGKRDL